MSLDELLPSFRSLPQTDKVRLIQLLAADLLPVLRRPLIADLLPVPSPTADSPLTLAPGDYPLWSPYDSHSAAAALLAALEADSRA